MTTRISTKRPRSIRLEIPAADLLMVQTAAVLLATTFGALALATGTAVVGFRRRDVHA